MEAATAEAGWVVVGSVAVVKVGVMVAAEKVGGGTAVEDWAVAVTAAEKVAAVMGAAVKVVAEMAAAVRVGDLVAEGRAAHLAARSAPPRSRADGSGSPEQQQSCCCCGREPPPSIAHRCPARAASPLSAHCLAHHPLQQVLVSSRRHSQAQSERHPLSPGDGCQRR